MERNANTGTRLKFIVDQEHGLDINLFAKNSEKKTTYSNQFDALAQRHTQDLLPEEMRIFYVALTRAELQLLLICGDDSELKYEYNYYAWQMVNDKACVHAQKQGSPLTTNNHRQMSFVDGELNLGPLLSQYLLVTNASL